MFLSDFYADSEMADLMLAIMNKKYWFGEFEIEMNCFA